MKTTLKLKLWAMLGLIILAGACLAEEKSSDKNAPQDEHGATLQDLIKDNPEVKTIHQKCAKTNDASPSATSLSSAVANCMWEEIEKKPELKKSVLKTLDLAGTEDKEDRPSKRPTTADKKIKAAFADPSLEYLREFLFQQYMKALQEDNHRQVLVGHEIFYQLYSTQVEKNILSAISNYCLKTTPGLAFTTYDPFPKKDDGKIDSEKSEENQKIIETIIDYNLERLKAIAPAQIKEEQNQKNNAAAKLQKNQNFTSEAYQDWTACATHLEHLCYLSAGAHYKYKKNGDVYNIEFRGSADGEFGTFDRENKIESTLKEKFAGNNSDPNFNPPTEDDDQYTQEQACLATQYLKDLRANLQATNEISAQLNSAQNNGGWVASHDKKPLKEFQASDTKEGIDALTTLTSGELMHDAAVDAGIEQQTQKIAECLKASTLSGDCRKMLEAYQDQNKEDQTIRKLLDRAVKEDAITTAQDAKSVERYLASEGYSLEQIKEMTSDEQKWQAIKDTIKEKYKNERQALAASLKDQLQQNRQPSAENLKNGQKVEDLEKERLTLIEQELKYRKETYPKILHYHNVVTSFISIEQEEQKQKTRVGQNFASLYQELDSNYFAQGASAKATPLPQEVADKYKKQAEALAKSVEASGIKKPQQHDPSKLSVQTINESFLEHGTPTPSAAATEQ